MKFRFYIAWVEGSDGAGDDKTGVHCAEDLRDNKDNGYVNYWEFDAKSEEEAMNIGYREAFFANFTAHDTVTDLEQIS